MASIVNFLIENLISLKVITPTENGLEVGLTKRYIIAGFSASSCLAYYFLCSLLFTLLSKTYK